MWITDIDDNIIFKLNKSGKVLDFGCGDGGYSKKIAEFYEEIHLYDFEEMIKEIPDDIKSINNVKTFYDWNKIKTNYYDDVIASFVFQHMHPEELDIFLLDLSLMTNNLIVKSRPDFNPYIRKLLNFQNDYVLPYIEKYFNIAKIKYSPNNEWFWASFVSKNNI